MQLECLVPIYLVFLTTNGATFIRVSYNQSQSNHSDQSQRTQKIKNQWTTLWVRNIPVEGEGCKWIYKRSYIWTAEKDRCLTCPWISVGSKDAQKQSARTSLIGQSLSVVNIKSKQMQISILNWPWIWFVLYRVQKISSTTHHVMEREAPRLTWQGPSLTGSSEEAHAYHRTVTSTEELQIQLGPRVTRAFLFSWDTKCNASQKRVQNCL